MKRVGLIIPHTDTTLEADLQRNLQARGFSIHSARVWLSEVTVDAEEAMLRNEVPRAVAYLRPIRPDIVVFGCTSAGAIRGIEGERAFRAWLASEFDCPIVSAFDSVTRRLLAAGAGRVHVMTPYIRPVHESMLASLRAAGVTLNDAGCMGYDDDVAVGRLTPAEITQFVLDHAQNLVARDRLFLSCTNLRAAECADPIKWCMDCDVTSSNLAILDQIETVLDT